MRIGGVVVSGSVLPYSEWCVIKQVARAVGSRQIMMIFNSDDAGREIRAVLNNLGDELDLATFRKLVSFARGYLAHAENDDNFMDQSCYFDGFDIFFSVSVNGWLNVSAYPSSVESGTNWSSGVVLFNTRGGF